MRKNLEIPRMGESISHGIIGTIFQKEGSWVEAQAELIEIETDKVNQVLYAPIAGVVHWSVQSGASLPIGSVIGWIEPQAAPEGLSQQSKETPSVQKTSEALLPQPSKVPFSQEVTSSPERKKLSSLRMTIARRLVSSLHETAMLTTFNEVEMTHVMELRKRHQEEFMERYGVKLGFMSCFIRATVEALKAYPNFNAYLEGDELVYHKGCHIGVAVGTEKGLFVPVIRNAETLALHELEKCIAAYAQKCREGTIALSELAGGGFTITNGGVYGSLLSTPILNPPQVGILGMHKMEERPIAVQGEVVIRSMMYLALSYDHRVVDGREAVGFLITIKECLEDPYFLKLW